MSQATSETQASANDALQAAADTLEEAGRRRLSLKLLALAAATTALGMAAQVFRGDGTSINAFLFLDLGLSHEAARGIERAAIGAAAGAAVLALARPRWFLLAPLGVYMLLEALADRHGGGHAFSEIAPPAHALRYLTPLALAVLVATQRAGAAESMHWVLRLGTAAVFLSHGYEALLLHPGFIDLVISSGQNLLGLRIEEAGAAAALRVIGAVDIMVAIVLVARFWPALLWWMAFWGLVTAFSRMTAYGWGAYPEVLVRTTHFLVPLALLPSGLPLLSRRRRSRTSPAA
ncbi:MAG: hypothetical protein KY475_08735 [Planctomycetes bacterium]|nr:hypothetical protein [Planctomycetota bacterium]